MDDYIATLNGLYVQPARGLSASDFFSSKVRIYTAWCDPRMGRYLRKYSPAAGNSLRRELEDVESDIQFMQGLFPDLDLNARWALRSVRMCRKYHGNWVMGRYSLRNKITTPKKFLE